MPTSLKSALTFLDELRSNNSKAWFDAHRKEYETARGVFEDLVGEVLHRLSQIEDVGSLTAKDCIFRINRDVRFSKDKTPYKTNFGAVIAQGGRKQTGSGLYVGIEPDDSFVAGGAYAPIPEELQRIRRSIADNPAEFQAILAAKDFQHYFGEMKGEALKTAPKGFDAAHPAIDLLRHKQFYVMHPLSDDDLMRDDLADYILQVYRAMQPFEAYLTRLRSPVSE
jgi:uncharacterized protein (TIGR02453 family)